MRTVTLLALTLGLPAAALAAGPSVGPAAPAKPSHTTVPPPPAPEILRQGGDTVADALAIPGVPYGTTGTTAGYTDDYDEVCPYDGSTAPDVVYSLSPAVDTAVDIDMCGSSYDTKIYVYDQALAMVACNDDFYFDDACGVYVSKLVNVVLAGGATYFLVIDGYGGEAGDYVLAIEEFEPCVLPCPAGAMLEGEPELVDGYLDSFNGGCNSPEFGNPFKTIPGGPDGTATFCGVSGWYQYQGNDYRDTDWFHIIAGATGSVEILIDAEVLTYLFEIYPLDCNVPVVYPYVTVGPCDPDMLVIPGFDPGDLIWIWVGPATFVPPPGYPDNEYDYVMWITGLQAAVATEQASWGAVKALYR